PVAGHTLARLGQITMAQQEVRKRNAVAVNEDQIIAGGLGCGPVPDRCGAKTLVLMPDMLEAGTKTGFPAPNHLSRFAARTVIGYQQLPAVLGQADLPGESQQHRIQRIRPVIGRHDDGKLHTSTLGANPEPERGNWSLKKSGAEEHIASECLRPHIPPPMAPACPAPL